MLCGPSSSQAERFYSSACQFWLPEVTLLTWTCFGWRWPGSEPLPWSEKGVKSLRAFSLAPCSCVCGGFPSSSAGKESSCNRRRRRHGFDPWVGKIPWRGEWQLAPVFLPGKPQGQRNLMGYSPKGCRIWHDWATVYSSSCGGIFLLPLKFYTRTKKVAWISPGGSIKNFQGFALAKRGECRCILTRDWSCISCLSSDVFFQWAFGVGCWRTKSRR